VNYSQALFVKTGRGDGTRQDREPQENLRLAHADMAAGPGHLFYVRLNEVSDGEGFDALVDELCGRFHAEKIRPLV
jgi:hypothetical protein